MDIVKIYGEMIKNNIHRPLLARRLITAGLSTGYWYLRVFPDKNMPGAFQYLNQICFKYIIEPLKHPEKSAWVNLFAPTEIIHAMGLYPLFVEAFASFLSGLGCEDAFIDCAEKAGISETLCSYHKAFVGAGEAEVLPRPRFAVTTSMLCDGNLNTFRHLSQKYGIPYYVVDVPYEYSEDGLEYITTQLKEMTGMIEDATGVRLDEGKLCRVLKIESDTRNYMKKYVQRLRRRYFPKTLTLEMYMFFTSYVFMGRRETYEFYRMLAEEIDKYPEKKGIRILWVHLIPFYQATLKQYFNFNETYQLLGTDFNMDCQADIDWKDPYRAIAERLLSNVYNGGYERKIKHVLNLIDMLNPDAVIHFNHWGCRQSNGGAMLLKEAVSARGIPFLTVDGDGADRRNSHDGQIRTRLEAFLEMLGETGRAGCAK